VSIASAQAAAFYREVAAELRVWTIKDDGGIPAPAGADGQRAMPFWSSKTRAEKVIASVTAFHGFAPVEISWVEFVSRWAPGLASDGYLVGVNWSGMHATGYDIDASDVVRNVEALIRRS
jgi:hypothetical protein